MKEKIVVRGLKDVAAAETKLSFINPMGSLYYLGYNIDDLIGRVVYEEVAYLLIHKRLPTQKELDEFSASLISEMRLPDDIIESIKRTPKRCHPMDVLRTEVSHLGEYDLDACDLSDAKYLKTATRLMAQVPTIVATLHRTRNDRTVPEPRSDFSFTKNFLYMFKGNPARERRDGRAP